MPLLLSGANPGDSVMTQRWSRRAKLDGELTQAHTKLSATSLVIRRLPLCSPVSTVLPGKSLSQQFIGFKATRSQSYASNKVGKFRGRVGIVLLFVFASIFQSAIGSEPIGKGKEPMVKEQPDHVVFRYKLCQPVSPTNLIKMMGPHFDDKKMATDMATARKMFGSTDGDTEGFQGDEASIDYEEDSDDAGDDDKLWKVDEHVWVDGRKENVQNTPGLTKEKLQAEIVESRTWLPRKKVLNRHVDSKVIKNKQSRDSNGDQDSDGNRKEPTHSDSYTFMRRRRRRAHGHSETRSQASDDNMSDRGRNEDTGDNVYNKDDDNNNHDGDFDAKDSKATNSIQLQLFLSGKDKKQRKKLKHKLRQSPSSLSKSPPWECKFSQRQRKMNEGVFPEWVLEGRCETDKCFYRLYSCVPIKYTVKLLQRDPNTCNPLPGLSNVTEYQERWELVQKYVTVGCECTSPASKNAKSRSRRLD